MPWSPIRFQTVIPVRLEQPGMEARFVHDLNQCRSLSELARRGDGTLVVVRG